MSKLGALVWSLFISSMISMFAFFIFSVTAMVLNRWWIILFSLCFWFRPLLDEQILNKIEERSNTDE